MTVDEGYEVDWDETPAEGATAETTPTEPEISKEAPTQPSQEAQTGEPEGYVPQKRFNQVWGQKQDLSRELQQEREEKRQLAEKMDLLLKYQQENAVRGINSDLQEAYANGDTVRASQLLVKHQELTQAPAVRQPQYAPQQNQYDQNLAVAIAVFENTNPWVNTDKTAATILQRNINEVASEGQHSGNYGAILEEAKKRTMQEVPHRFSKAPTPPAMAAAPANGQAPAPARKTIRLSSQEMRIAEEMFGSYGLKPDEIYKEYAKYTYGCM